MRPVLSRDIMYCISTWVFNISQTIFIAYFSRYRFVNVIGFYYILIFVFVTNISLWAHRNLDMYYEDKTTLNDTEYHCANSTTIYRIFSVTKPFKDPVLVEYCLLIMIFISEMWPKQNIQTDQMGLYDSNSICLDSGERQLLLSRSTIVSTKRYPISKTSKCVLVLALFFTLSFIIVQCILMYIPNIHDSSAADSYYLFGNILRIPLTIKCFHELSRELQPKEKPRKFMDMKHFIILITSLATCGFYAVESLAIGNNSKLAFTTRNYLNTIVRVTATALQTTFILQMKHYRISAVSDSVFSISNIFVIKTVVNFSIWFSYSFITFQYEDFGQGSRISRITWLTFKHFWLPFVIFYHFESFVFFYHILRE